MYYEFFIDVFFITNLVMDYFLLRVVNRVLGCSATHRRSLAGGMIGALAISVLVIMQLSKKELLNTILVHVVMNTIMVKFGCKIKGWNRVCLGVMVLYLASFFMGGTYLFLKSQYAAANFPTFLFLATASYLCITAAFIGYNRFHNNQTYVYEVVLYAGGKCREVKGFYDTGNHLKDPYTGKPVSIVIEQEMKALLNDSEISRLKPRYLPFHSVGCESGVLLAVTLDFLTIKNEKENKTVTHPVVALMPGSASFAGDCQMILHPELVDS